MNKPTLQQKASILGTFFMQRGNPAFESVASFIVDGQTYAVKDIQKYNTSKNVVVLKDGTEVDWEKEITLNLQPMTRMLKTAW